MYILKNALRNIKESKGKCLLIGIIIFVIGLSATLALSIKEAATTATNEGLENLSISASISYDRSSMMQNMSPPDEGSDNREAMKEAMQNQGLSLSELEEYAKASSVKDFYYTSTLKLDAETIEAIENSNGFKDMKNDDNSLSQASFSLIGYSSYDAMSDFVSESKSISDGSLFDIDASNECIISEDLATYNSLETGDYITFINPNNTEETYQLKITGIYTSSSNEQMNMDMGMSDPANQIYTSANTIDSITTSSVNLEDNSDNALSASVNGIYTFSDVSNYERFSEEVYDLGLSEDYIVSSSDLNEYENSLTPLTNLSNYANTFLIVILIVGSLVLIVFNILRIKERKYEIGVLSAIGMNKHKIALQFISELVIITVMAFSLSIAIGAISSVPVTNALLANTSDTSSVMESQIPNKDMDKSMDNNSMSDQSMPEENTKMESPAGKIGNYIDSVSSAANFTVIVELLGIGLVLCILSGSFATLTILRYEPLKILSNRE